MENGIKLRDGRELFVTFKTITGMIGERQEIIVLTVNGQVVHYEGIKDMIPPHYREIINELQDHINEDNRHEIYQYIN